MNLINSIFSEKLIDSLGWTIFHSLWQGILVTIVFALLMIFMRKFSSQTRYLIGVMSLLLILFMSIMTFTKYYNAGSSLLVNKNLQAINSGTSFTNKINTPIIKTNSIERKTKTFTSITNFFSSYFQKHLPFIVSLWIGGIIFLILKFFGSFLYTQRYRHNMVSKPSKFWKDKLTELKKRMKYEKRVVLLSSGLVKVPMVIGFFKPVILFPASMLSGMPVQQIEALLAHELAHIFRRDYIINILQVIIDIVYFYHPGIRWISSIIRFERENCCDDIAIEISGDSQKFAKALSEVGTYVSSVPKEVLAITGSKNRLINRIKRILSRERKISGFSEGFFAASFLGLCFLLLFFSTDISANRIKANESNKKNAGKITTKSYIKYEKPIKTKSRAKMGFTLLNGANFKIDGVSTNENNFYKKIKLIDVKTGKVVWSLKKKKLNNWGPVYRFRDRVKLKKGTFEIDIIDENNSFSIIFKKKKSGEHFSPFTFKAGKNSLADKMIDLFTEDKTSEKFSDLVLGKRDRELKAKQLTEEKAIKKYQKEHSLKSEKEFEEQNMLKAERKRIDEYFKQRRKKIYFYGQKEKHIDLKSKEKAKQKYEIQLLREEEKKKNKEIELIGVEKQIKKEFEKRSKVERELYERLNETKEKAMKIREEERALIKIKKEKIEKEREKIEIEKEKL